jgi:hypothetical protein
MAGKTSILSVKIIADSTAAVAGLGRVEDRSAQMGRGVEKSAAVAAVGLAAIGALAFSAGQSAADMEQAYGGVDAVFKEYAGSIHALAESAATDVNLAKDQYSEMATILGAQLKNMGIPMDDVLGKTSGLISLGADLAAQFGGTTSDAVGALSSLLRGERDPIERYGVSMNQAAIDAEKAALGLDGLSGEADKNASLQATLALLTRQTSDAQGAFGRETDTATSKQQNANAEWQNAKIVLGEQLLPVMADTAESLSDLATWVSENTELVTFLVVGLGILAAGILSIALAMKAYAAAQFIQTAAQWASNAAWLASPTTYIILGVIVAIGLLIAIIVLVVQNWDFFRDAIADGAADIGEWFDSIGAWASETFGPFIDWIKDALYWIDQLFKGQNAATSGGTSRMVSEAPSSTARTLSGITSSLGSTSGGNTAQASGVTNNVTVNGALDPSAVASQIEQLLTGKSRRNGLTAAGGQR